MELTLPVTLAVLGGALLHAAWNTLVKSSQDKELDTCAVAGGSGLISLLALPFVAAPAAAAWPWLAASSAVHILYFLFLAGAYRHGELSYVYPVMRGGGPMIVAATGAVAFAEILRAGEWLRLVFILRGASRLAAR